VHIWYSRHRADLPDHDGIIDWRERQKYNISKVKSRIPNLSILQAPKHAKMYFWLVKTRFRSDTIIKLQKHEPYMNV